MCEILFHFDNRNTALPVIGVVSDTLLLTSYEGGVKTGGLWVGSTLVAAMENSSNTGNH